MSNLALYIKEYIFFLKKTNWGSFLIMINEKQNCFMYKKMYGVEPPRYGGEK